MSKPFLLFVLCLMISHMVIAGQRSIRFAGVDWQVKNGGPWGPGPNYWSDSDQSVWVDEQGRLHLKIRKENNTWYCAEVNTEAYTTYGEHRFLVEGRIDKMDKNIVLGLFIYANDAAEIDIEYSKWSVEGKEDVGSYTVQPWSTPGNNHSFVSPLDSVKTTHFFDWQPGYVLFGSLQGHYYSAPPSQNYYIEQWIYTGSDNPSPDHHLRTHINFWLNNGQAPTDLSILEVVITDVVQPLSTNFIEKTDNHLPLRLELKQNYPNPFGHEIGSVKGRSSSIINYTLSKNKYVRLSVFNLLGQEVSTLVSRRQKAGKHSVTFNAAGLPGGIYFYRLQVGYKTLIRKMIYIP